MSAHTYSGKDCTGYKATRVQVIIEHSFKKKTTIMKLTPEVSTELTDTCLC